MINISSGFRYMKCLIICTEALIDFSLFVERNRNVFGETENMVTETQI